MLTPAAEQHNAGGATVFAEYWMQALDWGYATTDSSLAKGAYAPICAECRRFMDNFDRVHDDGGHFVGGRVTVLMSSVAMNDSRNGAEQACDVSVSITAIQTVNGSGIVTGEEPDYPLDTYRVWTAWEGNEWKVVAWKRVVS